jgi:DNA-binding NtrC family response regulator
VDVRIAVVDDEPDLRSAYAKILTNLGFPAPTLFPDGTSLIEALTSNQSTFDLIFIDYRLPEMNGIEAAKIVKRYRPDTKIILATAFDSVQDEALSEGFFFLHKPFSKNILAENVKNVLHGLPEGIGKMDSV